MISQLNEKIPKSVSEWIDFFFTWAFINLFWGIIPILVIVILCLTGHILQNVFYEIYTCLTVLSLVLCGQQQSLDLKFPESAFTKWKWNKYKSLILIFICTVVYVISIMEFYSVKVQTGISNRVFLCLIVILFLISVRVVYKSHKLQVENYNEVKYDESANNDVNTISMLANKSTKSEELIL